MMRRHGIGQVLYFSQGRRLREKKPLKKAVRPVFANWPISEPGYRRFIASSLSLSLSFERESIGLVFSSLASTDAIFV